MPDAAFMRAAAKVTPVVHGMSKNAQKFGLLSLHPESLHAHDVALRLETLTLF